MEIYGYSERGMVNSFFYECQNKPEKLKAFLKLLNNTNSNITVDLDDLSEVKIFIEQGLSDFGDADVIIITKKNLIFIEAKVNARGGWYIDDQFNRFKHSKPSTSNLFVQLCLKEMLMNVLVEFSESKKEFLRNNINQELDAIFKGKEYSKFSSKKLSENLKSEQEVERQSSIEQSEEVYRKIGRNPIIISFITKFLLPAIQRNVVSYFVSLVPDCIGSITHKQMGRGGKKIKVLSLKDFFDDFHLNYNEKVISHPEKWGYVSWQDLYSNIIVNMGETKRNFQFNQYNQIICKFPEIKKETSMDGSMEKPEAIIECENGVLYCILFGERQNKPLSNDKGVIKKSEANKLSMYGFERIVVSKDIAEPEFNSIKESLQKYWNEKWFINSNE